MAANSKVTTAVALLLAIYTMQVELVPLAGSAYSHARSNLYFAHDSYGETDGYGEADDYGKAHGYANGYGSSCDKGEVYGAAYQGASGGSYQGYGKTNSYDANPYDYDLYGYNSYTKDVYPTRDSYGKVLYGSGYGSGYDKPYTTEKYDDQAYGVESNGYYPIRYGYSAGNYVDNDNGYVLHGQF